MWDECVVYLAFFACIVGVVFFVAKCEQSSTVQRKEFLLACVQAKTASECENLARHLR